MKTAEQIRKRIKALEAEREAWISEARRMQTSEGYPAYCREVIRSINDQLKLLDWVKA
jgi:hypothetical protein